ncbi:T9SS type A sorting domain-containing protein [Bizionia sediminis]|uniref:T9SS type A sorting domain-containing protein n=1 Tax=Bizionia sediminis TaxID=1737064 RepID=A0ABW5KST7_9FLAO
MPRYQRTYNWIGLQYRRFSRGVLTNSTITRCSFIGTVEGFSQVGGVTGTAYNNTTISQCFSEGSVSGSFLIGGVVGYCTFSIFNESENILENSYSRANITATGGRAGGVYGGAEVTLTMFNTYATGTVSAPEFQGGVIGAFGAGPISIENSYFDIETSNNTEGVGGFLGAPTTYDIEGRTSADMKTEAFVALLNTGNTESLWAIDPNVNDGYPIFGYLLSVPENTLNTATVSVYPTVFTNNITIKSAAMLKKATVHNLNGVALFTANLSTSNTLDASNLSAGMYLLVIETNAGTVTKKVIKK